MTTNLITVLAVGAGITWLAVVLVSAFRNRGGEEIPPNLQPGITDQVLETRRLEKGQKAAIAFSAFLAISLPLYFLSEPARQQGFVEQFAEESITRGEHIVTEFKCFNCHGPLGVGGAVAYVEKRSGVTVSWIAPSLNDVLYRYDESELNFWITFGRGNTPMPPWGLAGGGPLNEAEVVDIINYLKTIQVSQADAVNKVPDPVTTELNKLAGAEQTIAEAIVEQSQVVANIRSAPDHAAFLAPISEEATAVLDTAAEGIDTDGDGISDAAEVELSALSVRAWEGFTVISPVEMDPAIADANKAEAVVANLEAVLSTNPIVGPNLDAMRGALESGKVEPGGLSPAATATLSDLADQATSSGISVPPGPYDTEESGQGLVASLQQAGDTAAKLASDAAKAIEDGSDPDGDGLSTAAEATITSQVADASSKTIPPRIIRISLDPTNPQSAGGEADAKTAKDFVAGLNSLETSLSVTSKNQAKLLESELAGLKFLEDAAKAKSYLVDIGGVAEAMGVDEATAARAVGLFNANCARCHTAGFSAGLPFTQVAGSGGFGPALWDGRPLVQFGELTEPAKDDLLIQFLIRGSEAQKPYGLNGFGSGRMPAFGAILSLDDLELLAAYLRAGNLDGRGQ